MNSFRCRTNAVEGLGGSVMAARLIQFVMAASRSAEGGFSARQDCFPSWWGCALDFLVGFEGYVPRRIDAWDNFGGLLLFLHAGFAFPAFSGSPSGVSGVC